MAYKKVLLYFSEEDDLEMQMYNQLGKKKSKTIKSILLNNLILNKGYELVKTVAAPTKTDEETLEEEDLELDDIDFTNLP